MLDHVGDGDLECRWRSPYPSADRSHCEAAAKMRAAKHVGLISRWKCLMILARRFAAPWQFSFDFQLE